MGGTDRQRARSRERLERLGTSAPGCESVQCEAVGELRCLIGFDRWCWPLADPATLLLLGGAAEHDYGPGLHRALELEYSGGDFAAKDVLARRASSVGCLSAETGGDLARFCPHRPGPPQVGVREDEHPQPPRDARGVQRLARQTLTAEYEQ